MKTELLVMQRNMGAYIDVAIQDSPESESNILEDDVTTNITFDCSCGQSIEVNSDAGGQRFQLSFLWKRIDRPTNRKARTKPASRRSIAAFVYSKQEFR